MRDRLMISDNDGEPLLEIFVNPDSDWVSSDVFSLGGDCFGSIFNKGLGVF